MISGTEAPATNASRNAAYIAPGPFVSASLADAYVVASRVPPVISTQKSQVRRCQECGRLTVTLEQGAHCGTEPIRIDLGAEPYGDDLIQ
jgi:hypothetical protein